MKTKQISKIQNKAIKLNKKIGLRIILIPTCAFLIWCFAVITPFFTYVFVNNLFAEDTIDKWNISFWCLALTTITHLLQVLWLWIKHLFLYKRIIRRFGTSKETIEIVFRNMKFPSLDIDEKELKLWLKTPRIWLWCYIPPIGFIWGALFIFMGDMAAFCLPSNKILKNNIKKEILEYTEKNEISNLE
ncbi:hypothetical protein MYMA111404_02365 [Mycoplasma marinum]|uniref:Uncharacterized protein n=1 Tax=Mycoplasma marinum TaxID=1937190 RepID=A0A4R0XKM5_9MOLU|nr:hypothetical protein [Mycoplasma marinum]TCG11014.1 hypothetical protein C4B24_03250 [Mycoplasma marinum]